MIKIQNLHIAVIGLGNIGLPLTLALSEKYPTIGFDIDDVKIVRLREENPLLNLTLTNDINSLSNCNIFIIAVSTSVNTDESPNVVNLLAATKSIAPFLKKNDLVIFESTVFPGCTEGLCVPILEEISGLKFNIDFFVGYSPERINTADNFHTLKNTIKITSGSNPETAQRVDELYRSIVEAGTYLAPSIKVAEAAKLLENAQRDINIAFMNNTAAILTENGISFDEVWQASSTKWNFLKFSTGLVGGDCLPLASQYLNHLSPEKNNILSAARETNDALPQTITKLVFDKLQNAFPQNTNPKILILGISYKPNTPSIKCSLVINLVEKLKQCNAQIDVFDPVAELNSVVNIESLSDNQHYHLIIKATNHQIFENLNLSDFALPKALLFNISTFSFKSINQ
ncbi:nucleotide sugar dehydrogenase [Emticicia aquatilis]|uniref:nucleotide sugar dehydrogenase n=1 Tax=Emticicia aquatilis TaxID=1537369 RepID=UPI00166C84AD|nr:nucleotide sugar dehydrogenase [Emticicia aquatilis]